MALSSVPFCTPPVSQLREATSCFHPIFWTCLLTEHIFRGYNETRLKQISREILKWSMKRLQTQDHKCAGEGQDEQAQRIAKHQGRGWTQGRRSTASSIGTNQSFACCINIKRSTSHATELTAKIRRINGKPDLIFVNDTFLNQTIAHITLEGYELIARRCTSDRRKWGVIATSALSKIAQCMTLVQTSQDAERFCMLVHTNHGFQLVRPCHKPPAPPETAAIDISKTKLDAMEWKSVGFLCFTRWDRTH